MIIEQGAELFLFSAQNRATLCQQVESLLSSAPSLSPDELTAIALHLAHQDRRGTVRAAFVASDTAELTWHLEKLKGYLDSGVSLRLDVENGIFLGESDQSARIGFLFPGQGSPPYLDGGIARRRFAFVDALYTRANLATADKEGETQVDQPAIITSSLAALHLLQEIGITAQVGIGHSLGELTALYWAGAMDEETLFRITRARAGAMSAGKPIGAMANLRVSDEEAKALFFGEEGVFVAGIIAPSLTVISGTEQAVARVVARAQARNIPAFYLGVPHAFHSPLIEEEIRPFAAKLAQNHFQPLCHTVISTVTGKSLAEDTNVAELLYQQVISPVQLRTAIEVAAPDLDLFIEVGAGKLISALASQCVPVLALTVDVGGPSMKSLLLVVGAVFALGVPLRTDLLFNHLVSSLVY